MPLTWEEEVAADNPLIWHKFNNNVLNRGSLSTSILTLEPTYTNVDTVHGTAAIFNGTNQFIQHTTSDEYYFNGWTIEAWFKINSASYYNNITRRSGTRHVGLRVRGYNHPSNARPNIIEAYTYDNQGVWGDVQSTGKNVNDGQWHHAAVVRAPGTGRTALTLYVDGVTYSGNVPTSAPITMGSAPQQIGREESGTEFFAGQMDEVMIYNTALSQSRILAHYNAPDSIPTFRGWGVPL